MALLSLLGFGPLNANQDKTPPATQTATLKVSGMHCGACASKVASEAKKVDGVKGAKVSQPKGTAEITYDPAKTTPEAVAKFITEKTSFKAEAPQSAPKP